MSRSREYRRRQDKRIKKKYAHLAPMWSMPEDGTSIGKLASTHGKFCSCHMCGNPRKWWKEKTFQEEKASRDAMEQLRELER